MSDPARDLSRYFTFRDYLSWPEEERWELIEGEAFMMSTPLVRHQRLCARLFRILDAHFRDRPCEAFFAPVAVLAPKPGAADEESDTVLEPDLVVVCDPSKLRERYIRGAPDLVVEVLSPSTAKRDLNDKLAIYARLGVREYWVAEPAARWLHRYSPGKVEGSFAEPLVRELGDGKGRFESAAFAGLGFDLEEVFGPE